MKIIGITGGIGTGKSTVLNILKSEYNAYVVETDRLAHQLMEKDMPAYCKIIELFGDDILDSNNEIDRSKLGPIVFSNPDKLQQLNEIVHPAVKNYIIEDIANKKKESTISYYVIEAALLLEDGYKEICDEIWGIHVTLETRIQRLIEGRGGNREKWETVIMNQSSEEYYRENCDAIIENNGDPKETKEQLVILLNAISDN